MLDKGTRRWEAANKRCTEFRLAKLFGQEKVLVKSAFLGTYFTQLKADVRTFLKKDKKTTLREAQSEYLLIVIVFD